MVVLPVCYVLIVGNWRRFGMLGWLACNLRQPVGLQQNVGSEVE